MPPAVEFNETDAVRGPAIFMIKLIRKFTGLGLADAKAAYEEARGFQKEDFPDQEAYQRKIEGLIYFPFTLTVPALYTRHQLYQLVSDHSPHVKYRYTLVKDPLPQELAQTERAQRAMKV